MNFVALTRTGRTCCGYRWLVVLESKAAEMIRFRHYKEAAGKKTVLGKGNNHDNWTLRVTWERRLRGPVGCNGDRRYSCVKELYQRRLTELGGSRK